MNRVGRKRVGCAHRSLHCGKIDGRYVVVKKLGRAGKLLIKSGEPLLSVVLHKLVVSAEVEDVYLIISDRGILKLTYAEFVKNGFFLSLLGRSGSSCLTLLYSFLKSLLGSLLSSLCVLSSLECSFKRFVIHTSGEIANVKLSLEFRFCYLVNSVLNSLFLLRAYSRFRHKVQGKGHRTFRSCLINIVLCVFSTLSSATCKDSGQNHQQAQKKA